MEIRKPFEKQVYKGVTFKDSPMLTKQNHKDECDVNKIIKRYKDTGVLTHYAKQMGMYGDAKAIELQEAIKLVEDANKKFMELPAQVRARFQNNPSQLLAFMGDVNNIEEAIKLGLVPKPDKALVDKPEVNKETPNA